MKAMYALAVCLLLPLASASAGGLAFSQQFIVGAPDQALADAVLQQAEALRMQFADDWLGGQLPPTPGRVVIHVFLSDHEDRGRTWMDDSPELKHNIVWLTTSRARATGSTLAHEISHVMLALQFPQRLPVWADEGIASQADDTQRQAIRRSLLVRAARSGNWPQLGALFQAASIASGDQASYAAAVSVTEYLIARADRTTFLAFAAAGKEIGWDQALARHYGLRNVAALQSAWQAWATQH
jgi:hypothetical protein